MRIRLLVSVAALAAALLVPSAALAVATPSITTPATSPFVTRTTPVHLVWGDTPDEVGYRIFRTDPDCSSNPVNLTLVGGDLPANTVTFDDTPPADGSYCYYVEAVDLDGVTVADSTGVVVDYDVHGPTSTLTPPAATLTHPVAVHATVTDPAGGTGVNTVVFQSAPTGTTTWTTFDSGTLNAGVYDGTLDTAAITGGDGVYDLRVLATDVAGNSAASTTVSGIRVDTIGPAVSITSPAAGAHVRGTVSVAAPATDASGVASVVFESSPTGANTWSVFDTDSAGPSPYHGSLDTTSLGGDGTYDLLVVASDTVGNPVVTARVNGIHVDNTAPSGALTAPLTTANVRGAAVGVAGTATDGAGSGVQKVEFQSSPAGAGTWTTFATDLTAAYSGTLDTTALAGDGLYDLRTQITDVAGNIGWSPVVANVRVDNTAPTGVAITSPAAAANLRATITVAASAADAGGSGVASVAFQRSVAGANTWSTYDTDLSSPFTGSLVTTGLGDGHYDLRVIATDAAGNPTTSGTIGSVTVDNTAPPVPSTPAGLSPVAATPTITFSSVTDALSGVDHYDVYRDGGFVQTIVSTGASSYVFTDTGAPVTDPPTNYHYTVTAVDHAGNVSAASAGRAILLDALGTSAPTGVTANGTPTSQHPQISWTAPAGLSVDHYIVYRNSTVLATVPSSQTAFTDAAAGEGVWGYQVQASSDAGEATVGVVSGSVSVVYDKTAPTAPTTTASAALDGSVAVSWGAASDGSGSGVVRYVVRRSLSSVAPATPVDGDAVCQGLLLSCTDTTAINGKLYSYSVFAVDGAGNTSVAGTSLSVTARDQLAPAAPTGLAATPGDTTVALSWAPAGANDDVAGYVLVAKPGSLAPASDTDGTRVCSTLVATSTACSATGLTNGATYTFGLFALDEALNRSAAASVTAVPNGPVADAKAPAAVRALSAKVSGHTVTLTWKNPADKDFDHVEITASERKPAGKKAAKRVYSGKGTKATTTLAPGQSRWFTVVAYDRVGNASAPATVHAAVAVVSPFGPAPHAKVHGQVQLRWPVVKGARYYNVQLFSGKKRILVSWPAGHGVQLPKKKLKRGTKYTWYVWPGLGAKSKAHYGKLIGKNVFTYAG